MTDVTTRQKFLKCIILLFQQKVAKSSPNSFSEETPAYNTLQPTSLSLEEGHYSTLGQ